MTFSPLSVRARLTLWHAGALALIITIFSAGIFLFVRAWLYSDLDLQLGRELATVERVYRDDPGELGELDPRMGFSLFQVVDNGKILHQTQGWERAGFGSGLPEANGSTPVSWTSSAAGPYRIGRVSGPTYQIIVARDEGAVRSTLRTLAIILLIWSAVRRSHVDRGRLPPCRSRVVPSCGNGGEDAKDHGRVAWRTVASQES